MLREKTSKTAAFFKALGYAAASSGVGAAAQLLSGQAPIVWSQVGIAAGAAAAMGAIGYLLRSPLLQPKAK